MAAEDDSETEIASEGAPLESFDLALWPGVAPAQLEEYAALDRVVAALGEARVFEKGPARESAVLEALRTRAEDGEPRVLLQRLLDADLLFAPPPPSSEGEAAGAAPAAAAAANGAERQLQFSADASAHPETPRYHLADFYELKRDPACRKEWLLLRGAHRLNVVFALLSRRDHALYLFRSFSAPRPRAAITLRDAAVLSVSEDPQFGFPVVNVATRSRRYGLCARDWDAAQTWLEALTRPQVGVRPSSARSLRRQRNLLMRTANQHARIYARQALRRGVVAVRSRGITAADPDPEEAAASSAHAQLHLLESVMAARRQAAGRRLRRSESVVQKSTRAPPVPSPPVASPRDAEAAGDDESKDGGDAREDSRADADSVAGREMRGALSLEEVLETPTYRRVLAEFMRRNFCEESLRFLEAVEAYEALFDGGSHGPSPFNSQHDLAAPPSPTSAAQPLHQSRDEPARAKKRAPRPDAMSDPERLRRISAAARAIYEQFIATSSPEPVNIDAATRLAVKARVERGEAVQGLFGEAHRVVLELVSRDVFPRFVQSAEFAQLGSGSASDLSRRGESKHRPAQSFALLPQEEDVGALEKLCGEFAQSCSKVKGRWYRLRLYEQCFKGSQLTDWLVEERRAPNRAAAVALGQRMLDAGLLCHVTREHDFEDVSNLFYTLEDRGAPTGPTALSVLCQPGSFGASMLLRGVRYNRVFVALSPEAKCVFIFRARNAPGPLSVVPLKGLHVNVVRLRAARSRAAAVSYLQFDRGHHAPVEFRVDDEVLLADWLRALSAAGVRATPVWVGGDVREGFQPGMFATAPSRRGSF